MSDAATPQPAPVNRGREILPLVLDDICARAGGQHAGRRVGMVAAGGGHVFVDCRAVAARRGGGAVSEDCHHEWDAGRWGVIIGVSRCKLCGRLSRSEDFPPEHRPEAHSTATVRSVERAQFVFVDDEDSEVEP